MYKGLSSPGLIHAVRGAPFAFDLLVQNDDHPDHPRALIGDEFEVACTNGTILFDRHVLSIQLFDEFNVAKLAFSAPGGFVKQGCLSLRVHAKKHPELFVEISVKVESNIISTKPLIIQTKRKRKIPNPLLVFFLFCSVAMGAILWSKSIWYESESHMDVIKNLPPVNIATTPNTVAAPVKPSEVTVAHQPTASMPEPVTVTIAEQKTPVPIVTPVKKPKMNAWPSPCEYINCR